MIVTAALATALGALPAAMPQTPTAAAIPPDSQSLRSHAEALQARFERLRLRAMPRTLSGGSQRCDAVIGRLCIWDDGPDARRPPPEPVETRLARLDLLVALDSVAQGIAGDHWVFGQRIRYLIEAERHADAAALARSCGLPTRWRCDAFLGYAHHRAGRVALAETAFRRTLRSMPPQLRKEWTDPAPLLDGDLRDWLALQPDSAAAVGRIWTLADPLFLVRGNDRWTAHLARHVHALSSEGARNPHQLRWGGDLAEAVVRYGWSHAWERSWPRSGSQSFSVSGRDRGDPARTLPPALVLLPPDGADAVAWEIPEGHARSAHLSPFLDSLAPIDGQIARFWGEDGVTVLAAWTPPADWKATSGPAVLQAGLFVEQGGALVLDTRTHVALEDTVRLSGIVPWSEGGVVSLEVFAPEVRRAWRQRVAAGLRRLPPDVLSISDLALLDGPADTLAAPANRTELDHVAAELRGSPIVRPGEAIGVAFEVYGLGYRAEAVGFRAWIERRGRGLVARAVRWLGFGEGEDAEVGWEEAAPDRPRSVLRTLRIGLPELEPGEYDIVVEVATHGRSPISARRALTVVGSP